MKIISTRASARVLLRAIVSTVLLAMGASPAFAQASIWTNTGTGDWFTSGNWTPTTVPVAGDTVILSNGGKAQINGAAGTLRTINIHGGSTLELVAGGSVATQFGFATTAGDGTGTASNGILLLNGSSGIGNTIQLNSGTLASTQSAVLTNQISLLTANNLITTTAGTTLDLSFSSITSGGTAIGGLGTVIYSADTFYTDVTTINSGATLQFGSGGSTGSAVSSTTLVNNGTLAVRRSGALFNLNNNVSGTGGVTLISTNSADVALTGTNTYTGVTSVQGGRLILNNLPGVSFGTTFNVGAGTSIQIQDISPTFNNLTGAGTVTIRNLDPGALTLTLRNANFTGTLNEAGTSAKSVIQAVGTSILAGTNSWTGGTTINAGGTLQFGNGGTGGNVPTGTITNNGTLAFAHSDNLSFSGVFFAGNGGVTQNGPGTLTLAGTQTYTGATIVNGGTLNLAGTLASTVTVNNGGTLKGSGTAAGTVVGNGGTTAPGNSIGTLNVAGNVGFTAGSIYQVEADATGAADRISATGLASLTGGTVQVLAAPGNYDAGLTYTILTAPGGVTGTFSNLTVDLATLDPTLTYTPTSVLLTLKSKVLAVFPTVSGTPNQIAAGTAIQAGGAGSALYKALLNFSPAAAQGAFDAASGEIHATLLASQQEAASTTRRVVLERMRAGIANEAGWSVWGSISGNWGDMDSDGNAAAAKRTGVSLTAGADTRLDDNWRGGFEGGYSSSKLTVAARNSMADIQSGHVGAYAYGSYDAIKLRLGGTYGFGTADTQRVVIFTGFNDLATASQDAGTVNLFGEAGYTFSFDGYSVEPFAGLSWTQVKAGSFRESGGSAALAGASRLLSDGTATLGAAFTATPYSFAGVSLAPTLRAGWQHAFNNDLAARSLSFISTGQGFTVLGTPLDADRAVIDAGASLSLGSSMNLFLGYTGTLSSRVRDNGVRITGSISL